MTTSEFDRPGQRIFRFGDELLPPCWIDRGNQPPTQAGVTAKLGLGLWQSDASAAFRSELTRSIRSARETVCVSSFLFADRDLIRALLDATARGVRVYLITAAEALLLQDFRGDGEHELQRLEDHKRTLNELAGRFLIRTAKNLHAKFVLVDPVGVAPEGFLLTGNLTKEGFDRNPEFMVELSIEELRDLYRMFLIGFWEKADRELLEPDRLRTARPGPPIKLKVPESLPCTLGDLRSLKESLVDLIGSALHTIHVSTFGIDADHVVTRALIDAAKGGKKVLVLTRHKRPKNMSALLALAEAGADVRAHRWLHAKALVVDTPEGNEAIVTTSNLTKEGLDEGFEAGVRLKNERADTILRALRDWWDGFPFALHLNAKRSEFVGDVALWENGRLTEKTIAINGEKNLGSFEAPAIESMDEFAPPFTPPSSGEPVLYHEYLLRWTITPPRLPMGAKRDRGDFPLPVFRQGREVFVAITSRGEVEQGGRLAKELGARLVVSR